RRGRDRLSSAPQPAGRTAGAVPHDQCPSDDLVLAGTKSDRHAGRMLRGRTLREELQRWRQRMTFKLNSIRWGTAGLVLAVWSVAALPALGQTPGGAIEGVVKDESGAVLPGVTVEASSPALIERTRSAVTDNNGNYQFLRLPAGTYSLRSSLTGFETVERANVVINAGFTATINTAVKVGSVQETLTVTGASPLVDVRTTTTQVVVTAETVNT